MWCRVGSAYMRIYKKENVQILVIFVKLSVVHFQQQWLCSHKGVIFPSFSQARRHPALALALAFPPRLSRACQIVGI